MGPCKQPYSIQLKSISNIYELIRTKPTLFCQLGKLLKVPVIKFLLHSASYMWFLITLLTESIFMEIYRSDFASRKQNILHNSLHMIWVAGGSRCQIKIH